ncbi:MAG TPA: transposase [Thermodesulfobacteriota bacterium]|nr:transposase [Thermodesulfobacteriota bacterium]
MQRRAATNLNAQFYRAVFESTPDALILLNPALNIAELNQQACNLFSYTREYMLTLNATVLFPPKVVGQVSELFKSPPESKALVIETEAIRKDGTTSPVSVSASIIDIPQREFVLLSIRELTERREFQRERDQLLEQLKREKEAFAVLSEITANAISTSSLNELELILKLLAGGGQIWIFVCMAWRGVTDEQWEKVRVHPPRYRPSPKGGRPRADGRRCFEGILWVLWTGAQWSELPKEYGSPSTCWRRLRQ